MTHIAVFCILALAVTGLVCGLVNWTYRETGVWPRVFSGILSYEAKGTVVNSLLELVPVGYTTNNSKRFSKVLYGWIANVNVPLEKSCGDDVRSSPAFSWDRRSGLKVGRLAITVGRLLELRDGLVSAEDESIQRRPQVHVESWRDAKIFNGKTNFALQSISPYVDWFKNLWIAIDSQPRSIAAHESVMGKAIGIKHCSPHAETYDGVADASEDSNAFQHFPPWDGVLSAGLGFVGCVWGWVNIRSNRGTRLLVILFFLSIVLSAYGYWRLLDWGSKF